jgi:hypothetical protein
MEQCISIDRRDKMASNVIPFVPRPPSRPTGLSMRDRMDIAAWQEHAAGLGYDRLAIHERGSFDPPDVENYLSVYRRGKSWASWSLARRGGHVLAWCSRTGADIGTFESVGDALQALLASA